MALPDFSMRQLLEAGAHFGHQTHRWNPKMAPYLFGKRNNIHIIDLSQSVPLLHQALRTVSDVVARGGRVLMVGTKRQASELVADAARRSAQYYVNDRWLGGMLTNWKTISNSIKRLRELDDLLSQDEGSYTKKETLNLTRERDKLERALGGIKDMGGTPDLLFVVDTNRESIAIKEAQKLKIPVLAILDSNCDPQGIDYPVPGNDDASRAIALYCDLVAKAAIDGIARQQGGSGVDLGAQEEAPQEPVLAQAAAAVSDAASGAADAASGAAETVADTAAETAGGAVDAISAAAASAAAMAGGAASTVASGASEAASVVSETTSSITETIANAAAAAVEGAKESLAGATEAASNAVSSDKPEGPLFTAPEGEGDDLTEIKGIGPVAAQQLKEQGITTFAQIAGLSAEDIQKVDDYMPFSSAQIEDWQAQAKEKTAA